MFGYFVTFPACYKQRTHLYIRKILIKSRLLPVQSSFHRCTIFTHISLNITLLRITCLSSDVNLLGLQAKVLNGLLSFLVLHESFTPSLYLFTLISTDKSKLRTSSISNFFFSLTIVQSCSLLYYFPQTYHFLQKKLNFNHTPSDVQYCPEIQTVFI